MPAKAPRYFSTPYGIETQRLNQSDRRHFCFMLRRVRKHVHLNPTLANEYAVELKYMGYDKMMLLNRWAAAVAPFGSL